MNYEVDTKTKVHKLVGVKDVEFMSSGVCFLGEGNKIICYVSHNELIDFVVVEEETK